MSTLDESRMGMVMHVSPKRHLYSLKSNQNQLAQVKEIPPPITNKTLANKVSTVA